MIIFREINEPRPPYWEAGDYWYVEYHDDGDIAPYPLGFAFVMIGVTSPLVYYILVADQFRRRGIGTAIIEACKEKWPDIRITDGISKGGRGLLRSMGIDKDDGVQSPSGRNIPTIKAQWCDDGKTVRCWCKYCKVNHVHGVPDLIAGGVTHRVAHCANPKSRYLRTGYTIEVDPRPTELAFA